MKLNTANIQLIKARKGLRSKEIAERYGCSKSFINMVIKKESVRTETAGKLARALGVDVAEIIQEV